MLFIFCETRIQVIYFIGELYLRAIFQVFTSEWSIFFFTLKGPERIKKRLKLCSFKYFNI